MNQRIDAGEAMIDMKLGPYELREVVGKGGMATVYRAYQPSVDRSVAIKIIHSAVLDDSAVMQRFQREARLIARLEHPHILPVYDFEDSHEPPYIVMRYLHGGTLKDVLKRGQLPVGDALFLLQQVASALDYAHRQGILHRDIKPSNIMIDEEGNAFITDFGIARIISSDSNQITQTGAVLGTPDYMAPEQAMGVEELDKHVDIYSLGVIFFQIITGQLPYIGSGLTSALMKHVADPVPSAFGLNDQLPPEIDKVIKRVMAKNPDERHASASEFVDEIIQVFGGMAVGIPAGLKAAIKEVATSRSEHASEGNRQSTTGSDSQTTPSEQRKQLTILYANITELMEIVEEEAADPMEIRHKIWDGLDRVIARYGGAIDSHTGDTVLAIWGAQVVAEDDAERAVRAGLAMQKVLAEARIDLFGESDDEPLPIQIGIHTGVTLLTRDEDSGHYTASGPTVNLASRLERSAPAGGMLISPDTYRYVRGKFLVEGLAPIRFRGSKKAIETYLVKGAKFRTLYPTPQSVEGIETKTIGREAELKQLAESLETAMEDFETQMVTVVGEAGVGKTRLIYELNQWEEKLPVDFRMFRGYTTPQMVNQPFALIRELLAFRFGLQDSDDPQTIREKFERGVAELLGPGTEEQAHVIAYGLGFGLPESAFIQDRETQQLNSLAQKYIIALFVEAARHGPPEVDFAGAWIQLENIHWADDRSLDLINELVEEHIDLPLVVTCTARPTLYERRPTWGGGQDFHLRIDLRQLSKRDSRKLVKEILQKVETIPLELRDLIVERSEGNPFYMEELVKMLVEDRVIIRGDRHWAVEIDRLAQVRVPLTLTGLIQARLDSLLPDERITLQRAAVIGRIFWDEALSTLQAADGIAIDIPHALEVLARRELIQPREETTFAGAREYIFESTMLRDVTYNSIIKRQQRDYHFEVANWLVGVVGERTLEYTPQIAGHYEIAGENVHAAAYYYRAGEKARQVGAYHEAVGFLEQGSRLLEGQVDAEARHLQIWLGNLLGIIAEERGQLAEAHTYLSASLSTARDLGNKDLMMRALTTLGVVTYRQGKAEEAETCLQEALTLARSIGDRSGVARALMWLGGNASLLRKQYEQAEERLQDALATVRQTQDQALTARICSMLGENARYQGKYAEAVNNYQEALSIYRQLDNQFGIALIFAKLGHIERASQQAGEAQAYYLEALQTALAIGILQSAIAQETLAGIAGLNVQAGEYEDALELLGLVLNYPDLDEELKFAAQPILEQLRAELREDVVETGLERGKTLDLGATVRALLDNAE